MRFKIKETREDTFKIMMRHKEEPWEGNVDNKCKSFSQEKENQSLEIGIGN